MCRNTLDLTCHPPWSRRAERDQKFKDILSYTIYFDFQILHLRLFLQLCIVMLCAAETPTIVKSSIVGQSFVAWSTP